MLLALHWFKGKVTHMSTEATSTLAYATYSYLNLNTELQYFQRVPFQFHSCAYRYSFATLPKLTVTPLTKLNSSHETTFTFNSVAIFPKSHIPVLLVCLGTATPPHPKPNSVVIIDERKITNKTLSTQISSY